MRSCLGLPLAASSQVPQNKMFAIHITRVKRLNEGCTVDAESTTVRFKISSDMPATCGMLRADETYKAFRATVENDPKDETKDSAILVITENSVHARKEFLRKIGYKR